MTSTEEIRTALTTKSLSGTTIRKVALPQYEDHGLTGIPGLRVFEVHQVDAPYPCFDTLNVPQAESVFGGEGLQCIQATVCGRAVGIQLEPQAMLPAAGRVALPCCVDLAAIVFI